MQLQINDGYVRMDGGRVTHVTHLQPRGQPCISSATACCKELGGHATLQVVLRNATAEGLVVTCRSGGALPNTAQLPDAVFCCSGKRVQLSGIP